MRAGSQPVDADRLGIPLDWHRSASGERNGLTGQSRRDVSLLQRSCSPDAGVGGDTGCGLKAATAMTAKHDIVAFPGDLEIRAALARVVASVCLRGSPRLISFLCFVVEATLTGQADRLKGYCIAVGALGRSDNFDPQTNPIVRVEAARLRRALRPNVQPPRNWSQPAGTCRLSSPADPRNRATAITGCRVRRLHRRGRECRIQLGVCFGAANRRAGSMPASNEQRVGRGRSRSVEVELPEQRAAAESY